MQRVLDPSFPNSCTSPTLPATANAMSRMSCSRLPFTSMWNIPASVEFPSTMHCIHGSRTLSTVSKSCLRVVDPAFPSDSRLVNTLPQFLFFNCLTFFQWPGYRQWSRQIPTKDFRSPPGPITIAKLAKNVAKCVQRFMLVSSFVFFLSSADIDISRIARCFQWKMDLMRDGALVTDLVISRSRT